MNFESFINVLIRLKVMVNVDTAKSLWDSLGAANAAADLEYYRNLYNKTYDELCAVKEQLRELKSNQAKNNDDALAALRAKLCGDAPIQLADWERDLLGETNHDKLVRIALDSAKVIEFMQNGQKTQAIKELRTIAHCDLKEAKNACDDSRVMAYFVRQQW